MNKFEYKTIVWIVLGYAILIIINIFLVNEYLDSNKIENVFSSDNKEGQEESKDSDEEEGDEKIIEDSDEYLEITAEYSYRIDNYFVILINVKNISEVDVFNIEGLIEVEYEDLEDKSIKLERVFQVSRIPKGQGVSKEKKIIGKFKDKEEIQIEHTLHFFETLNGAVFRDG